MARRYATPSVLVTDELLAGARERAAAAAARLRDAESADPTAPTWDGEYASASAAAQAADRRVKALESLRANQVERSGRREAAVKASAADLKAIPAALAKSRDAVAAAAAAHLKALAGLAQAEDAHNALLAASREKLASAGLRVRDDLAGEGQEHAEGAHDRQGLRAAGIDWTPVAAGALAAHALRLVHASYGPAHPLALIGKYQWRSFEVTERADGLAVPSLEGVGVRRPAFRPPVRAVPAQVPDTPAGLIERGGVHRGPRWGRTA